MFRDTKEVPAKELVNCLISDGGLRRLTLFPSFR